jgi:myotubularin-related protein 1/2
MVGITGARNAHDEALLQKIAQSSGVTSKGPVKTNNGNNNTYVIADARPLINSLINQAAGKGSENEKYYENTTVVYLDIPNIHVVRKSYDTLCDACTDETSWLKTVDASGWLTNLTKVLKGALKIVHCIAYEDLSVLVHCSDGWDRTAQLTSLSMLMLDPYYRTLRGFLVLIEKEWLSFGHKFADRLSWVKNFEFYV